MPYHLIDQKEETAVEVEAGSLEDLFCLSCHAWRDTALEFCDSCSTDSKLILLSAPDPDELLTLLLNEINTLLNTQQWEFNSVDFIEMINNDKLYMMRAEILGEPQNEGTSRIKSEIKKAAHTNIEIDYSKTLYKTKLIFDIR